MNPGALRDRLEIYDRRAERNANGYVEAKEELVCVVRGRRDWVSDREIWAAHAAQVKSVLNWECRFNALARVGLWVKWRGEWQEIIAVQLPLGNPGVMILKTAQKTAK